MGIFVEYRPPIPLPDVSAGFEHATLDLKRTIETSKSVHLAKDVAAFANHFGGVLIIGASEGRGGTIGAYHPMTKQDMTTAQEAISKAVAQRCSPQPVIDFAYYEKDDGYILTVLVQPFIGQPIGVKVSANKDDGGFGGKAFFFPVRSGSNTVELLPEQLPMYMSSEWRKHAIILSQAKYESPVFLYPFDKNHQATIQTSFLSIEFQDGLLKVLKAHNADVMKKPSETYIPLDAIVSAWKTPDGVHVVLKGAFTKENQFYWRERVY